MGYKYAVARQGKEIGSRKDSKLSEKVQGFYYIYISPREMFVWCILHGYFCLLE